MKGEGLVGSLFVFPLALPIKLNDWLTGLRGAEREAQFRREIRARGL